MKSKVLVVFDIKTKNGEKVLASDITKAINVASDHLDDEVTAGNFVINKEDGNDVVVQWDVFKKISE